MVAARLAQTLVHVLVARHASVAREAVAFELIYFIYACAFCARVRLAFVDLYEAACTSKARITIASIRSNQINTSAIIAVGNGSYTTGSKFSALVDVNGALRTLKTGIVTITPVGEHTCVRKAHTAVYTW